MDTLTRRRFLVASGVTGAAALAAGATTIGWREVASSVSSSTDGTPQRGVAQPTVVLVTLYGGNDGLSTLVPYADDAYQKARPDLAYSADEVLKLDDQLGLNPAMKGFASLWQQGRLAVVRGVGYPKPDLSHFRSMDIWQSASPSSPVNSGWIGRWLDATARTDDNPLRAVNIGAVLPPLAVGVNSTAAALDVGKAQPLGSGPSTTLQQLSVADGSDSSVQSMVRESYRSERVAAAAFDTALANAPDSDGDDLSSQLDAVARCIHAGVPTRVYSVNQDGFDTHADEKGTQSALIGSVDSAVSKFLDDVGDGVLVLVYSEFGRRVTANASEGTDHGTAGPVFAAGSLVKGGFHGEQPSLTDLDEGDLKFTVDFRAVYGEVLHRVLGADPAQVLDTVPDEVGFLA